MSAGRKKEFEKTTATRQAMQVFWAKGYTGTSLCDLTGAMGINKPSLYSTFGNKEALFIASAAYYVEHYAAPLLLLLQNGEDESRSKSLKQRLRDYLLAVTNMQSCPDLPSGCFVALCASEAAGECMPAMAVDAVYKMQNIIHDYFRDFLMAEKSCGNLSIDANVGELTLFLITFIHGTAAMARSGKTLDEIQSTINSAIKAFI